MLDVVAGPRDTCIITCYFNPARCTAKRQNLGAFLKGMAAIGAIPFIAELIAPECKSDLAGYDNVLLVKGDNSLWQKERLLNLLVSEIPREYTKVVWSDCDVLFQTHNWLWQTSRLLDSRIIVQPFTTAIRLPKGHTHFAGEGAPWLSFAALPRAAKRRSGAVLSLGYWHGHPGFVWAARRDFIERVKLYDACLSGSGDHLMAHAFFSDLASPCIAETFGNAHGYYLHYRRWAGRAASLAAGSTGFLKGTIFHLWHGDLARQRYIQRDRELAALRYDPEFDIRTENNGLLGLTQNNALLRDWNNRYSESQSESSSR